MFPLIEGTERGAAASYTRHAGDGTPLLGSGIRSVLETTLDKMEKAARESGVEYEIGICGEMNEIKLHPENLGPLIHRVNYFSASRPRQIPVLKHTVARTLLGMY